MAIKKGSKNAIENRGAKHVDERGEQIMVMMNGKKLMAFEKNGVYTTKQGIILDI